MQVPKKHFPVVGLLVLVLVAVAGGSVYYYQFVVAHHTVCGVPANRVIFMTAIIQEDGGFTIKGAATVNQTVLPVASNSTSAQFNTTGINFHWYNSTLSDAKTITANQGDNITIYMFAINSTDPSQYAVSGSSQGHGHGFGVDGLTIPVIHVDDYGTWGSTTFTASDAGSFTYRCLHLCSNMHGSMTGPLVVSACG